TAAGAARPAKLVFADLGDDVVGFQTENLGRDQGRDGSLRGAQILGRSLGRHRAVAADDDSTLIGRRIATDSRAAPGVQGHADAVLDGTGALALAGWMPLLLPVGQLGGNLHLRLVNGLPLAEPGGWIILGSGGIIGRQVL